MFEIAELGRKVDKKTFREEEPPLRQELLELQQELRRLDHIQVIMVFGGVEGGGKSATINLLNEWMDSRWLATDSFDDPAENELERPEFWRYWRALPPRGRIGLFISSWYHSVTLDKVYQKIDDAQFDKRLDRIVAFENALANDGAAIIKFWMHLSRDAQEKRLKQLEKDPLLRVRVKEQDWKHWKMYDQFIHVAERIIMRTNTGKAPWHIIEGADENYRSLTVGTLVRDMLRRRIEEMRAEQPMSAELNSESRGVGPNDGDGETAGSNVPESRLGAELSEDPLQDKEPTLVTLLTQLDMSKQLDKEAYVKKLKRWQAKLYQLHMEARARGVSSILVFEGPDAAGKGGAIRRITGALDARSYRVHGFAAPTDEERAQHYLWRFWRHLSRAGRITIFDRSWYGRVLVERVEGFATDDEWRRAYAEINDFEEQLIEHGIVLVKYWVHITPEEQLSRFKAREVTPHKRWKITDEDWRNRERWWDYELAVSDMVQYTSTQLAPWTLVEGNDKRYARIKALETFCNCLEKRLAAPSGKAAKAH